MSDRPWEAADEGLRLAVRLQPGARGERVDGIERLADGRLVLKVRVAAPPEGGKANAALIKLLAKRWGLAKSGVEVAAGHSSRSKTLLLRGDPETLAARLVADLGL